MFRGSALRTLMLLDYHRSGTLLFCAQNLRLPKALNVLYSKSNALFLSTSPPPPPQVSELIHLRYFAFPVSEIPDSISYVQNLQTLIVPHENDWLRLPMEIWRMSKLRHLHIYNCVLPIREGKISVLENLQTLSTALNLVCTKGILDMIPNVKRLALRYAQSTYDGDWHLDNLVYLYQLQSLTITVCRFEFSPFSNFPSWEKLNPVFPKSLRKLTIGGDGVYDKEVLVLPLESLKIIGSLPNLEVLKLRVLACQDGKWETNEGGFLQLKFLLIEDSNLQHWITESDHFPSLKSLLLYQCEQLREIPDGIGDIPTLELIEVDKRNKSLVESAKRIQEEQLSFGNEDLQVCII